MKIRFKYFKVLMILFLPLQICIFHYGAILWRSLSDFEYLSLPVTTKSLSPACGSTDCQLAKRFNYSRCLIFTRDLSSAREQNKTIFFFNPINVSTPPSDTKNTKSPDCLNSMFDPSSALNIKVFLTPQNTGNYKRSATPLLHTVLHTRFRPKSGSIGLGK